MKLDNCQSEATSRAKNEKGRKTDGERDEQQKKELKKEKRKTTNSS